MLAPEVIVPERKGAAGPMSRGHLASVVGWMLGLPVFVLALGFAVLAPAAASGLLHRRALARAVGAQPPEIVPMLVALPLIVLVAGGLAWLAGRLTHGDAALPPWRRWRRIALTSAIGITFAFAGPEVVWPLYRMGDATVIVDGEHLEHGRCFSRPNSSKFWFVAGSRLLSGDGFFGGSGERIVVEWPTGDQPAIGSSVLSHRLYGSWGGMFMTPAPPAPDPWHGRMVVESISGMAGVVRGEADGAHLVAWTCSLSELMQAPRDAVQPELLEGTPV